MRGAVAFVIAGVLTCAPGCAPERPAAPGGVGPDSPARPSARPAPQQIELVRPVEPAPAAPPPSAPPVALAPVEIGPDIADLGPFDVESFAQARARAEQRIGPANAAVELSRVRAEIEERP